MPDFIVSKYVVTSARTNSPLCDKVVVFSTRTQKSFLLTTTIWSAIQTGSISNLAPNLTDRLIKSRVLVPVAEDELSAVIQSSRLAIRSDNVLYECIQPTAFCNFGCNYCGQEHTKHRMTENTQDRLVARIRQQLSQTHFDRLRITWFGGEPLLAMDEIRSLTRRFKLITEANGQDFQAAIVTNGYSLTRELVDELTGQLLVDRIEVTIDGLKETHDARRPRKGGGSTFDRVFSNFCSAAKVVPHGVRCVLRCNVDSDNAGEIPVLIHTLASMDLQENSELYFAPVHNWGNDAASNALQPSEFANLEIQWFTLMKELGFRVPLVPKAKPVVCMAVNPNAGLTDPYGTRFNCTEVSLVPTYGTPNLYSLEAPAVREKPNEAKQLGDFIQQVSAGKYDCSSCEMLPVCGGGCPKSWREGNAPCPSAKRNLPERLLLALATGDLS